MVIETANEEVNPEISLNALTGQRSLTTTKLTGKCANTWINILVDCGSTDNFIKDSMVQKLKLKPVTIPQFKVFVGSGDFLWCKSKCLAVTFSVQNHVICVDLFVIELKGVDMVLGGQWLKTLGPIAMDYDKLTIVFTLNGKQIHLQGEVTYCMDPISSKQLAHMQAAGSVACLFQLSTLVHGSDDHHSQMPSEIRMVLDSFMELFDEPKDLPPYREDDHRIHLVDGSTLVNVRPYRYPMYQKTEIEKLESIEYLGHIVSSKGLAADPHKLFAMVEWPVPTNLKQLRGFLGLTGYYRRFIKHYASVAQPLTSLLKKDSFKWSSSSQEAFDVLKRCMVSAPVLAMPDFSQQFVVETDASTIGIGAVLSQNRHPIAFFSKQLTNRLKGASAYRIQEESVTSVTLQQIHKEVVDGTASANFRVVEGSTVIDAVDMVLQDREIKP
ncbi:putative mitochondrial protein [Senna tora]|uniref:Putative mitochondrial protein n=1 Tax=Senna tora TaxID=362788 RepID=A0A835CKT2_9FABA|nr:putative mitochondrial protein [Senna tora]